MASKILMYEAIHTLGKRNLDCTVFQSSCNIDINEMFSVFLEVAATQYTAVLDHLFPVCEDVNSVCHISSQPSLIYSQCGRGGSMWGIRNSQSSFLQRNVRSEMMPFSSTQAKWKGLKRNQLTSGWLETIFSPCLTHRKIRKGKKWELA